jgi:hypothetical protein
LALGMLIGLAFTLGLEIFSASRYGKAKLRIARIKVRVA